MATKNDNSILAWLACIVGGVLLCNYLAPSGAAAADNAAGIQSDENAAAMTTAGGDPIRAEPGHNQGSSRPWFGGPPVQVGEPEDGKVDDGQGYVAAGNFMEDTTPQQYPGGYDPFSSPRFDRFEM